IANLGRLTNDHTHTVIDKEPAADISTGVNFNTSKGPVQLRKQPGRSFQGFFLPHLMCDAVHPNCMQTGIPGSDLKGAACSGVSVFCSLNVLSEAAYDSQSVPFKKKCCCRAQHRTSEFYSLCRSGDGFGLNDAAFGTDDTEGS